MGCGARSYVVQKCVGESPGGEWSGAVTSTRSKSTVETWPSGNQVWLRGAAVGAEGQGPWSEPVGNIVP